MQSSSSANNNASSSPGPTCTDHRRKKDIPVLGPEVSELVEQFIESKTAENTCEAYRRALEEFLDGVQTAAELKAIRPDNISAHRNSLFKSGRSKTTVNLALSAIRGFFRYLKATGTIANNPGEKGLVNGFRVEAISKAHGLTPDDIEAMLATCKKDKPVDKRDRAILIVGLIEGLRRSEIAGLRVDSLQKDGQFWVLELRDTKGGHLQKVKLDARAHEAINDWLAYRTKTKGEELKPSDRLFLSFSRNTSKGKPLGVYAINEIVKRRAKKAGISKKITTHSLRHTCATLAIDNGAPVLKVQRHLRHKDPKTTIRYYRNYDDLKQAGSDFVKW